VHACGLRIRRHSVGSCQVADSALQRVAFGLFSGNSRHPCGRHMALGLATKSCCLLSRGSSSGSESRKGRTRAVVYVYCVE
jgi:hypothetical protein